MPEEMSIFIGEIIMEQIEQFIQEQVKSLVFKNVGLEESLLKSRLMDSITVIDLAVAIEEKYDLKIPYNEINEDNFDTIVQMVEFLKTKGVNV